VVVTGAKDDVLGEGGIDAFGTATNLVSAALRASASKGLRGEPASRAPGAVLSLLRPAFMDTRGRGPLAASRRATNGLRCV